MSLTIKWTVVTLILVAFLNVGGCYYYKGKLYFGKSSIPRPAQNDQQKKDAIQNVETPKSTVVTKDAVEKNDKEPEFVPVAPKIDYPVYKPLQQVSGKFNSLGSDTMEKIMEYCGEGFSKYHPQLRYRAESEGSSDAVNALVSKKADIGPMSRPLKDQEAALLASTYSFPATQIPVALDALAVYVNPQNPLLEKGMTIAQVDAIFSSTRAQGYPEDISKWGQLGLKGEWADKGIKVFSRNSISGTYGFFLKKALSTKEVKGKYKTTNQDMFDSESVVSHVAEDKFAIGYSGIGYNNPNVETMALSQADGEDVYKPTAENVLNEKYPLGRYLYITLMISPDEPISKKHAEFIRYMFSKEAQEKVKQAGYIPIGPKAAREQLEKLNLQ